MPTQLDKIVTIAPAIWPGAPLPLQPGDLSQFTPLGLGLGAPLVMRPWDKLEDVGRQGDYYGLDGRTGNPLLDAPLSGSSGGTIYFDSSPNRADLEATLRLLTVQMDNTEYAIFLADSADPGQDRVLTQIRLVSSFALGALFGAKASEETIHLTKQPLAIGEMIWKFIEDQQREYGAGYSSQLDGLFGGDGDWAREKLAFGFLVENEYQGVYRLWSRAWLVTK
jgi:hypothetical protein